MTSYELHLLGLAVEEAFRRGEWIDFFPGEWNATDDLGRYSVLMYDSRPRDKKQIGWGGDTIAEALTNLLTDLGVEVPERPSAGRVAAIAMSLEVVGGDRVKYLRSVDRLALLALLEGGAS